ncbi:MAG: hypothetical protein RL026_280 [Pseudomonadota bacterium]|jgi:negative regulator of sigma E activity
MSTEERDSQLSALFDGELPAAETALVLRRLARDPALQARWSRYALVGARLRDEPLLQRRQSGDSDLAARLRHRLETEPALDAGAALAPIGADGRAVLPAGGSRRWAWGGAVAASVALVAVVLARWQQAPATDPLTAAAAGAVASSPVADDGGAATPSGPVPSPAAVRTDLPSYTTPSGGSSPAAPRFGAPLVGYVSVHSEYALPAAMPGPYSAVMYGTLDPTENTVEMTEAEVGARR